MACNKPSQKKENIPLLKLLWQEMPINIRRFIIIVFIILVFSTFFAILYFGDAIKELVWMSRQIEQLSK